MSGRVGTDGSAAEANHQVATTLAGVDHRRLEASDQITLSLSQRNVIRALAIGTLRLDRAAASSGPMSGMCVTD